MRKREKGKSGKSGVRKAVPGAGGWKVRGDEDVPLFPPRSFLVSMAIISVTSPNPVGEGLDHKTEMSEKVEERRRIQDPVIPGFKSICPVVGNFMDFFFQLLTFRYANDRNLDPPQQATS